MVVDCTARGVTKFINPIEVIMVLTYMVPIVSSLHTSIDLVVATADPALTGLVTLNPRWQSVLFPGGFIPPSIIRVIFLKAQGKHL